MDQFKDQGIILVGSVGKIQPAHIHSGPEHFPENLIRRAGRPYRRYDLGFGILVSYHSGIFYLEKRLDTAI